MNFIEKNVIITGGTTGIGFATAQAFIDAGANVWITGRGENNLNTALTKINSPRLKTIVADTSNLDGITALERAITDSGITIHVLLLNAAIGVFKPIEQMTEEDFDSQFNTNVKGHYFTLQKLIPHLAEGASVLFTSSTAASAANLNTSVYAATKGALNKIAQVAANELVGRKIRVNVVSPGPVETEGLKNVFSKDELAYVASLTAVQRLAQPVEIAKTLLFLASDDSTYITGTELHIDGGYATYALR
jgi:NAD(P)-dependent dehydrogenase (short-subunit alcohol dehydrogenase family)